jgi:formiminotetrahydrofolate cyclodeaminase
MDFERYLDALASAAPTPGGGSAATLVGALGAALCAMVARITLVAPKHMDVHADADAIAAEADELRAKFTAARPLDEAAFQAVVAAQALPRSADAEKETRRVQLQAALTGAAEAPLYAAELAEELFGLAYRTAALGNAHLMSDVDCALQFARAAFAASAANVAVNHHYIKDEVVVAKQSVRLAALATTAQQLDLRTVALIRAK